MVGEFAQARYVQNAYKKMATHLGIEVFIPMRPIPAEAVMKGVQFSVVQKQSSGAVGAALFGSDILSPKFGPSGRIQRRKARYTLGPLVNSAEKVRVDTVGNQTTFPFSSGFQCFI